MTYSISVSRGAQRALAAILGDDFDRVTEAVADLATDPRPPGCIKLKGRGGWRIRVGNFRVIYDINDGQLTVSVIKIGNRRDVYR